MRFNKSITIALIALAAFIALTSAGMVYIRDFPQKYPDKTLELEEKINIFFARITLPIKLARLALRPVDEELLMPVYGEAVSDVRDTWGSDRDGGERLHEGQDIFAETGTPVFSATYGYVTRMGFGNLGGNYVFITGAGGRRYYYAHLDRFADGLYVGQEITSDTVVGFVGNTGNAQTTPPHLHFGMYKGREAIDPLPILVDRFDLD